MGLLKEQICLACSGGGHLGEMECLKESYKDKPHFFLTDSRENSRELVKTSRVYYVQCPRRNLLNLIKNSKQSFYIIRREKPSIVISTGADTALMACVWGKLFGARVIFIESFCRVKSLSLTGKIVRLFADSFFVQWPGLEEKYPGTIYAGSVV